MDELVFIEKDRVLTNSLLVAKKFGKSHKRVMQDIRDLGCSSFFGGHNFVPSSYMSKQNKELPMYVMTKDGFTLLVMGYTGETSMRFKEEYISAFNNMESMLNSDAYILMRAQQILQKSLEESKQMVKQLEKQSKQQQSIIEAQIPKVEYANNILNSLNTYTTIQIAKELNCSAQQLNHILQSHGVIEKKGGIWIATDSYVGKGYLTVKCYPYRGSSNRERTNFGVVWTEAGRNFVHTLILNLYKSVRLL